MDTQSLVEKILVNIKNNPKKRYIVAIAGPPASGKSTLAEKLSKNINQKLDSQSSAVIPMDGFHFDNERLEQLQLRHRKGAENTFDSLGFVNLVKTLKETQKDINIHLFDRNLDATIPDAKTIHPKQQILLIEGNYLLLDSEPWIQIHEYFDFSIFLKPDIETIEHRLIERWLENGYDRDGAKQRAFSNDIPNAEHVLQSSVSADLNIE